MMEQACQEQRVRFYRAWSSQAAGLALAADHPAARTRCAHSASIWTLIADALETGKKGEVERLTNNLFLLNSAGFVVTA
jgi:hypothetical protein